MSGANAPRRSRRGLANEWQRPLTRYLPVDRDDFDLRRHVESAGERLIPCLRSDGNLRKFSSQKQWAKVEKLGIFSPQSSQSCLKPYDQYPLILRGNSFPNLGHKKGLRLKIIVFKYFHKTSFHTPFISLLFHIHSVGVYQK